MDLKSDNANEFEGQLRILHGEIDECRVCEPYVSGYLKPPSLYRGTGGTIMVVGQGPGRKELKAPIAFAGQSGKTLDKWLVASGADRKNPRKGIYLTSIIKCYCPSQESFGLMARNCSSFLLRQITTIRPKLIITLGRHAYENLTFTFEEYDTALCSLADSAQTALVTPFDFHLHLLPWPHPSGLNRWLNDSGNKSRLEKSFASVRAFLEKSYEI